jgi:hypothetical protein
MALTKMHQEIAAENQPTNETFETQTAENEVEHLFERYTTLKDQKSNL